MIRLIQRRLIIPRGDTGTFSIPVLTSSNMGDVSIFTIFNPLTHKKIAEKRMEISDGVLTVTFSHGDTVNLPAGQYVWDIKFYRNPVFAGEQLIDGEEIDSYYAAFSLPVCEIRETGDSLLMDDDTPQAKLAPDQIDLISAAITATQTAKEVAVNSAADAETSAFAAATSAQVALDSKDAALASQTSAATSESNAAESAAAAQVSATQAAQIAQQIHEEIPTKVSDLVDDSGHYTKPATGIPASDLEETYLTSFTEEDPTVPEWAKQPQKPTYTAQEVGALPDDTYIPSKTSDLVNDSDYAVDANYVHTDNNYTTAEKNKLEGIAAGAEVNVNADWNAIDGDAFILNKPTKVSDFTNDAGYLTEHQDISGKANSADLAAVATSGSYEDLSDKPTIPEVPVQDVQVNGASVLDENGIASIPTAANNVFGVVKIRGMEGVMASSGTLVLSVPSTVEVKMGNNAKKAIFPYNQHASTFYGLAKAAGDTTQSQSDNAVGAYTDSAKTAIQTMLDVPSNAAMTTAISNAIGNINSFDMAVVQTLPTEDISTHTIYLVPKTGETNDVYDEYVYINDAWEMVGNTQIDLSNYVQKTDYATNSTAGVVKVNPAYGLNVNQAGFIALAAASDSDIRYWTTNSRTITPATQHAAVFYGLARAAGDLTQPPSVNAVGAYTDEAKAAIQQMLDVPSTGDIPDTSIYATKVDTVLDTTLSRGRRADTIVGEGSFAFGSNIEASGANSFAIGNYAMAKGDASYARGTYAKALGNSSSAEGSYIHAVGTSSHAEGGASTKVIKFTGEANSTIYKISSFIPVGSLIGNTSAPNGVFSAVVKVEQIDDLWYATLDSTLDSENSIADLRRQAYIGSALEPYSHTEGSNSIALGMMQHVEGRNNYVDANYVHIVGNGFTSTQRSNAYALDWDGNGHYAGDVYVHANADSTGGTKVLCEADFATTQDIQNIINGGAGA